MIRKILYWIMIMLMAGFATTFFTALWKLIIQTGINKLVTVGF